MKTTTIGRIGAIVTGAAMLGTAIASALAGAVTVDSNLDKGFFFDDSMNPKVQIVVGEKAQASDGAVAGQIAALIGNMAFATTTTTASGGTVAGGTATCTPSSAECTPGNAEGQVVLSWEATGMVGELQQRQMNCNIYSSSNGLAMTDLDNGGDSGSFCDSSDSSSEVYGPDSTVGTTLVGACETGQGSKVSILRDGEFENNICTVCYSFCDLALNCEPHKMAEWVNLTCSEMKLGYDCDSQQLVLDMDKDSVVYNVFTDDILTKDIMDDNDKSDANLLGQSYLGKIILGQNEYYVEDVNEKDITIACGDVFDVTTSGAVTYTPPKEGSTCSAADDTDNAYSIKLVGAQQISDTGVVDVTLEVTKPDGTTETVNSGISGTPVVGDLKIKLLSGTASSNIITGEQSFSAKLLVWYVPSEYKFEDGERYTEAGAPDKDGIWKLRFNGGNTLYVYDLGPNGDDLEDDEELVDNTPLPDDITENEQWDNCYEDVSSKYNDTKIIRFLQFSLQEEDNTQLTAGDYIQLPFNDGKYLLSNLKFGYLGLMDENFKSMSQVDTTTIDIEVDKVDVVNETDEQEGLYREVTADFVDQWGDSMSGVRLDEGPYEDGDMFFDGAKVYKIDSIDYSDGDDEAIIEYSYKDGSSWTEKQDDDACNVSTALTEATYENVTIRSQVRGWVDNWTSDGWHTTGCGSSTSDWIVRNLSTTSENDWEIWVDRDADQIMEMAYTGGNVETEFKNDVWFSATEDVITVEGGTNTGGEDDIVIALNETGNHGKVNITNAGTACSFADNDCEDIATGEEDGTLVSLSGATVVIDGTEIEEPENSGNDTQVLSQITMTVPEPEMRPTIFFGVQSALNTSSLTITEADEGTVVDIGGVDVTVEDFGVSVTGGGLVVGNATTVECPSVTCPDVQVETSTPNDLDYNLVVVEGEQSAGKNLVLIGGPSVNSLTKDLVSVDDLCPSSEVVKLSGTKLVVAGCEAGDTKEAAEALMNWLKNL